MNGTTKNKSRQIASVPNKNPHDAGTKSDDVGLPSSQCRKFGIPRSNAIA
jgi:hypothetical protein